MTGTDNEQEEAIAPAVAEQRRGPEVIGDFARRLPGRPGVYRMIDDKGDVIYVGKARSLRNRVQNYVRMGGHTNRIAAMIALTANMEFVTTRTEAEALLLEANLIKKFKPRFNVVLRDDKSFPYILIATQHQFAQLVKHRGARSKKGSYYGPFASAGAVNRTINALQKAFLLRSCSDTVFENRTRPCLLASDQAMLGAVHRGDRHGGVRCASCARLWLSWRARAAQSRPTSARPWRRLPPGSISNRLPATATGSPP